MSVGSEGEKEAEKELSLIFSLILNFAVHDHKEKNTFSIPNRAVVIRV